MKKPIARPPLFEVRNSPIHGSGVFALRRIRRGTTVIEYTGERVSHDEADSRYEDKDPDDNHTFLFTVDSRTVIDGGVDGNEARFINHGCDPNCASTTRNKRIFIEAIRTIQPGEELAYDYQIDRDADDPPDVDVIFACRCGAAKCRGSMLVAPKRKRSVTRKDAARKSAGRKAAKKGSTKRRPPKERATRKRATKGRRRAAR
jgi:SET domain-containing protein